MAQRPQRQEYPAEVKWIKTISKRTEILRPEDLLTEDEVMALIQVAEWSRDKAFVAMLYDSARRIGEDLRLRRKNIVFDHKGALTVLHGRTGERRNRLILSTAFMAEWLNDHLSKDPEAPLWIHSEQRCREEGITHLDYYSARALLARLGEKAGITKPVNPHAFRHARVTKLAGFLTEHQLKTVAGWTPDSKMAARYVHLAGRDVDNVLLRMHGIEPDDEDDKPKLTIKKCVLCGHTNSSMNGNCGKCGMILDPKLAAEMIAKTAETNSDEVRALRQEMKDMKSAVDEMHLTVQRKIEEGIENAITRLRSQGFKPRSSSRDWKPRVADSSGKFANAHSQ